MDAGRLRALAAGGAVDVLATAQAIQRSRLEIEAGEPLTLELRAFLKSLRGSGEGAAPGAGGRTALAVAAAVRGAMKQRAAGWAARTNVAS